MPNLLIIIGSVREGRVGEPVANWFEQAARQHGGFDVAVADLKEVDLPLLSEPNHPRLREYTSDKTKAWSATVDAADAIVFVTPEYNFNLPPALLNALDHLSQEWAYKACGVVSYGGISAGTRSSNSLRILTSALLLLQVGPAVNIPFVGGQVENGQFNPAEQTERAVAPMLDELLRVDGALRTLWG
jgi:NAD(P)H-dependent FMN reductase